MRKLNADARGSVPFLADRNRDGTGLFIKAVSRDQKQRFETAEELMLALERGASRPLTAPPATPLIQRDPTMLWKLLLGFSVLMNVLLIYWLAFLPR